MSTRRLRRWTTGSLRFTPGRRGAMGTVQPAGVEPTSTRISDGDLAARPRLEKAEGTGLEPARSSRLARLPNGWSHRSPRPSFSAVPAGLEPATFRLTTGRTTIVLRDIRNAFLQRCRRELNPILSLCRRAPHRPAPASWDKASGGSRTHIRRLTRALLIRLSFAGISILVRSRT